MVSLERAGIVCAAPPASCSASLTCLQLICDQLSQYLGNHAASYGRRASGATRVRACTAMAFDHSNSKAPQAWSAADFFHGSSADPHWRVTDGQVMSSYGGSQARDYRCAARYDETSFVGSAQKCCVLSAFVSEAISASHRNGDVELPTLKRFPHKSLQRLMLPWTRADPHLGRCFVVSPLWVPWPCSGGEAAGGTQSPLEGDSADSRTGRHVRGR